MKDMLFSLFVILSLSATAITSDQEAFYPAQSGTILKYSYFNTSNQSKGYVYQTVNQIKTDDSISSISYTILLCDKNRHPIQQPFNAISPIINNSINLYPFHFIKMQPNKDIQITGMGVNLPSSLWSDQLLDNGEVIITQGLIKTRIDIKSRLLIAKEQIKVAAGKYSCFKIREIHEVTTAGQFACYYVYNWYAAGIGLVKSITYDKQNKCISRQELCSVRPPHAGTSVTQPPQNNS